MILTNEKIKTVFWICLKFRLMFHYQDSEANSVVGDVETINNDTNTMSVSKSLITLKMHNWKLQKIQNAYNILEFSSSKCRIS